MNVKTDPGVEWARAAGERVATRRAERRAEQEAEAAAAQDRRHIPVPTLRERFAAMAHVVLQAIDAFATAAAIAIEAEPVTPTAVQLRHGDNLLRILLVDDTAVVLLRSTSRSDQRAIDLTGEDFDADAVARRISEEWIQVIEVTEGGAHVAR